MIHYHGTPITPRKQLQRMAGRDFCVSFAAPRDADWCWRNGRSVMFDNGAFSTFTRGETFREAAYYAWVESMLNPPHWAVVPDVIGGDEFDNWKMSERWPFGTSLGAPVWHLGLSTDYLLRLLNDWPRVCLGSSAEYWQVGSARWCRRMDEVFNLLDQRFKPLPWIHGLRMLSQIDGGWPLASADSTNVAQNFKKQTGCAECMANRIDATQPTPTWTPREIQGRLLA